MNLTKFQVNAVKSMARGLAPLERKLKRLEDKETKFLSEILAEKLEIQAQLDQINSAIITYTGGFTVTEVLTPEGIVSEEAPEGDVEENATADMTEISGGVSEEWQSGNTTEEIEPTSEIVEDTNTALTDFFASAENAGKPEEEVPVIDPSLYTGVQVVD